MNYQENWKHHNNNPNASTPYPEPVLRLEKQRNSQLYALTLHGANEQASTPGAATFEGSFGLVIDPFQCCKDPTSPLSGRLPSSMKSLPDDKKHDLIPVIDHKGVTSEIKSDLGLILKSIAQISNINIF